MANTMICPICLAPYEAHPGRVRVEMDHANGWLVAYIDDKPAFRTGSDGTGLWAYIRDDLGQPDWRQILGNLQFNGQRGRLARRANESLHRHTWEVGPA